MGLKEPRHGRGIPCKQKHNIVVDKVKDITCLACRNLLQENPNLAEELALEPVFDFMPSKKMAIESIEKPAPICKKCKSPMRRRTSSRGPFYGCSNYPRCTNTMSIK